MTATPDDADVESSVAAAHQALDEADELMEVLRHTIGRAKQKAMAALVALQEEQARER